MREAYYEDQSVTLHHGDCIEVMRNLPDNSVDSIVTDPPYGLGFMGKDWDTLPPGEDWARECLRVLKPGGYLLAFGGTRTWHRLAVAVEDAGFEIRDSLAWLYGSGFPKHRAALKPAFEPVVMARKPFKGSLDANEAIHGTGALNIDATRVGVDPLERARMDAKGSGSGVLGEVYEGSRMLPRESYASHELGRWPSNVILDESMAEVLDDQSGTPAVSANPGGASRFFYVAKAPKKERPIVDGIAHPTVKPLALMRWLARLVTPAGGTVLEPFAGSGTTVEACIAEGLRVVAIEQEESYLPLIMHRINKPAQHALLEGMLA